MLTVRKADRQRDKGLYKLRLTCEGGNFEATGFVNVLDVPSKPRNFKPDEVSLSLQCTYSVQCAKNIHRSSKNIFVRYERST